MPNYVSGTITCPMPPDEPPGESKMVISPDQPDVMCPGEKAVYDCNAGGINVRFVSIYNCDHFFLTILSSIYKNTY